MRSCGALPPGAPMPSSSPHPNPANPATPPPDASRPVHIWQARLFEAAPSPDCLAGLWRTFEATVQELSAKGLLQRLASGAE
eukprot:3628654-Prymnesium_polylepis.1